MEILKIPLSLSNAYLVRGDRPVLIDTGVPGEADAIQRALRQAGIGVADLSLIIHTHAHFDHCGSTSALLRVAPGLPTLMHAADAIFARQGKNQLVQPAGIMGWLAKPFLNRNFERFEPGLVVNDAISLAAFGLDASVVPTPGHTAGSLSVVFGNGSAIVGDLLAGNLLNPNKADYHLFMQDKAQNNASIRRVIGLGVSQFYVGHGGPFSVESVFGRLDRTCFHP
jgi:hydroxyacylglutathione hydrolase